MDANGIEPATTVPASQKLGKTDAARMARAASRVIVAKGKKVADKRETSAKRDWNRQKQRLLKDG